MEYDLKKNAKIHALKLGVQYLSLFILQYLAERRQAVTFAVDNLLQVYFPEDTKLRKAQHEEEMAELAR